MVIEVECQRVVTSVIFSHLEAIADALVTILEGVVCRRGVIEEGVLVREILECEVRKLCIRINHRENLLLDDRLNIWILLQFKECIQITLHHVSSFVILSDNCNDWGVNLWHLVAVHCEAVTWDESKWALWV